MGYTVEKQAAEFPFGLSDEMVRWSREQYGENRISRRKRKSFLKSFLESFGDPMIKVLLIALAINVIFLFRHSDWFESLGIAVAILLATLVSTISEYGSESAFERLQEEAARIQSRVRREKGIAELPVEQIVVGDLVVLQAGDRVPADGIVLSGAADVDQSSLNGESKEAKKHPGKEASALTDLLDHTQVFCGTIVCAGELTMRVTSVGDNTFYGRLAGEIQEETRESPLKIRLSELAKAISSLGYCGAALVAAAYFFNAIVIHNQFNIELIAESIKQPGAIIGHVLNAATLAVTVIVMAVPEGLPMMITVVLSANMKRMLKDNVLVRKLVGIETAGSLNILFTDKTGTLTRGRLEVTKLVMGNGRILDKNELGEKLEGFLPTLHTALAHNCGAELSGGQAIGGNATDRAILEFACKYKSDANIWKIKTIPFTSESKVMLTAVEGDIKGTLIKGAPEKILKLCTAYYKESGEVSQIAGPDRLVRIAEELAGQAFRLIAVAVCDETVTDIKYCRNLKLVGLLAIRDEMRREAVEGVRQVMSAGIQTVMITGDSKLTAMAIAKEAGLYRGGGDIVMTSDELNALTDGELSDMLPKLRVVARALPSDKSRLVRIAQAMGLVAGMTGDGVNDAPALKKADVGFAMGSGTEVAKEAGDIVILDDNFISISRAVCYGRTIFKSIRKFLIFQLTINMCAVCISVIGPLVGVDSPVTVIQMLWINMVMDTLAGLAFAGEQPRLKYMSEPPKRRDESIINRYMWGQIIVGSIYMTVLCLVFLKHPVLQNIFMSNESTYIMTAFFALFMFSAIFTSFCARTHQINLLDYLAANKPFLLIMAIITVIQILLIYFGGAVFRTVGMEPSDMIIILLLSFTVVPVDIIRKIIIKNKGVVGGT